MKRLNGTDAVFLAMETPDWHQHVAGLVVLDPGERELTFEKVVANIEDRLRYTPKFTWKLRSMPLGLDRPMWVDDPDFDVRDHVRRIAVPAPGGPKEIGELVGTLSSMQLDRRRPLWEWWYIEGLSEGRVGLMMKYHHCLLDGVSGMSLASVILDLEPDPAPGSLLAPLPTPEEATAGSDPGDLPLLGLGVANVLRSPVRTARYIAGLASKGIAAGDVMRRNQTARSVLRAPKTPFNAAIGPRRNLAFTSVALDDLRALKNAHGVKVNDVVLALVAGSFRSYLEGLGELPDAPLVTAVPVSTRAEGDNTLENQITIMLVSLATDVIDPVERLKAINASTAASKEMTSAMGARQIQSIGEVAAPLILGTALRAVYHSGFLTKMPMRVNTMVSNVPGPPVDLYTCGAKITGVFPSSVIMEGMGVNVTVASYGPRLDIGIHVDPDLVPDVWALADGFPGALAELLAASDLGEPSLVVDAFHRAGPPKKSKS